MLLLIWVLGADVLASVPNFVNAILLKIKSLLGCDVTSRRPLNYYGRFVVLDCWTLTIRHYKPKKNATNCVSEYFDFQLSLNFVAEFHVLGKKTHRW